MYRSNLMPTVGGHFTNLTSIVSNKQCDNTSSNLKYFQMVIQKLLIENKDVTQNTLNNTKIDAHFCQLREIYRWQIGNGMIDCIHTDDKKLYTKKNVQVLTQYQKLSSIRLAELLHWTHKEWGIYNSFLHKKCSLYQSHENNLDDS